MRIIAGELKGRKLYTPNDKRIRPTSDKVKESLFNMISNNLEDAIVIDLFSGTGNLGLEAISRGASHCYFGDKSKDSLELTNKNITYCKVSNKSILLLGDFKKVLNSIKEKVDIIFLDPPYNQGFIDKCLEMIYQNNLLTDDGIIIAEHNISEVLPNRIYSFKKIKEKRYGTIGISIYSLDLED